MQNTRQSPFCNMCAMTKIQLNIALQSAYQKPGKLALGMGAKLFVGSAANIIDLSVSFS